MGYVLLIHITPHAAAPRHVDAAMETVEVANKELKVETRLRNIEHVWKEQQLGFIRHRDTEVLSFVTVHSILYKNQT